MPSDLDTRRLASKARIADVATAKTLPAYYYTDPAVLDLEKRELFFKTWQFACFAQELADPGSFVTMSIFDQEVFLVRGADDQIRGVLQRVCASRPSAGRRPWNQVAADLSVSCLDVRSDRPIGRRPPGRGHDRSVKSDISLTEVRVDRVLDLVFVNLDWDAEPLDTYAAGLADDLQDRIPGLDQFVVRPGAGPQRDADMQCNWKAIVDNYLECYHCETAHPTFCDLFQACDVTHTFSRNHMLQHLPSGGKAQNMAYPVDLENDLLDGIFGMSFRTPRSASRRARRPCSCPR